MNDIEKYYKESLLANLCKEYKGEWQSAHGDKEKLVRLCRRQQSIPHVATFAYNGKGLTKEFVKSEYAEYINGFTISNADGVDGYTYGLYADWNYENELVIDKDVVHIMWTDGASVVVPKCKCPSIYVSNCSRINISGDGFNSIVMRVFDESVVTIDDFDENSDIIVYKYSEKAVVEIGKFCLGRVKVFNKELKL